MVDDPVGGHCTNQVSRSLVFCDEKTGMSIIAPIGLRQPQFLTRKQRKRQKYRDRKRYKHHLAMATERLRGLASRLDARAVADTPRRWVQSSALSIAARINML